MNTLRATRIVLRLGIPLFLLSALVLYWNFGFLRVQQGMDTMPETHPPGTLCLIEKSPSSVEVGAVVFVELPDGSSLLTRVASVAPDGSFTIRSDNRRSGFCYLEELGAYPLRSVQGVVLSMFVSSAQGLPRHE